MTTGITISLPELIQLKRYVRTNMPRIKAQKTQTGAHQTRIMGRGMDFAETRHYQAGDEIRHMAWRSTAKTGRPHIKLYHEEQERPVVFMVDFNPSMHFGTQKMFKSVLAAQLTSLMVWISLHYKDKVGGFLFSAEDHLELKPKTNQQGTLRLLKALSTFTASLATHQKNAINHSARPLHEALGLAKQIIKPGSLVILISDFYTLDSQAMTWLARLKAHSQIAAYRIADPFELALPPKGHYPIQDLDQKRAVLLNLKSQSGRQQAQNQFDEQSQWIQSCFQQLQAPFHCVSSTSDWIQVANATFPRGRHHG